MVFVKDFRKDFYDVVQHQRVLILVAFDVDALCACKILQHLFQCDQVLYTIVPVEGKQELEKAFLENSEGMQYVILINCGATIDIVDMLQPEEKMQFFICDSHRPIDIHNVFNQIQVKLLMKEEEEENIPDFNLVFRDEEESDQDSGNDSDTSQPKKKRFDEEALERKREKRLWAENRQKLLFEYTEFSGYGISSALTMYEMAWKMSKDTNDLLWLAILGATEQYINNKVERDKYVLDSVSQLQSHVSRLNHRPEDDENTISVDCLKLSFDQELQLYLYRHWSLFDSLCHSEYTACKFRVWTMKGKKRLHEFLADMGLPLVQCQQKYTAMDVSFKETLKEMIGRFTDKYGLNEMEIFLPSFHAKYGYKNKLCATDVVFACEALLESIEKDSSASDNFLKAQDILNRNKTVVMQKGLGVAKNRLKAIVIQVQSFLDMNQIISAGPFLYSFVQEGTVDGKYFSKPSCLCRLAKFALEAYCSVSKNKRARTLPFVLGAHHNTEHGTMLIVGIPPESDKSKKNCFGKAFEQAAASTNSRMLQDNFDQHIVELKTEDKTKLFDALINLLQ